jgi:hypothetical protein
MGVAASAGGIRCGGVSDGGVEGGSVCIKVVAGELHRRRGMDSGLPFRRDRIDAAALRDATQRNR